MTGRVSQCTKIAGARLVAVLACHFSLQNFIDADGITSVITHLLACNIRLEKLRFLFRLAMDLRYTDGARYEFAARSLDEVGRLVGGWLKVQRNAQA